MQRFQTVLNFLLSKQTQFLAGGLLAALPAAAQMPTEAPDVRPERWIESAIKDGCFGALDLDQESMTVEIYVDGDDGLLSEEVILSRAGEPVRLRAEWDLPQMPPTGGGLDDKGLFRQSGHFEVLWAAEPQDTLASDSSGAITWRSGRRDGTASWVSANVSSVQANSGATSIASPDLPTPGVMASGTDGVLIIPSVTFDRAGDGILQGQNIGIYPSETASSAPGIVQERAALYRPPTDFYRIDNKSADAKLTEHLTLGELMPAVFEEEDTRGEQVRFAALSPRLISFMKAFESALESRDIDPANLKVLRGYVSPTDRRRLERRGVLLAEFTRYQYGDAVGLVIDSESTPQQQRWMDDLNNDGAANIEDAEVLAAIAKDVMDELGIYGGVGVSASYEGPGPAAGSPYLHVDLRGWYVTFREE